VETVTKVAPVCAGVVGEARFELARLATPAPKAGASAVPPLARGFVPVMRVLLGGWPFAQHIRDAKSYQPIVASHRKGPTAETPV
jgi:hypothetical protein